MEYVRRVRHVPGLLLLSLVGCQQSDPGVEDEARTASAEAAATAQLCDASCTHILQPASFRKLDGNATSVAPGSRVCLAAGNIEYLRLENLHGTAASPITVINCGGQATVGDPVDPASSGGFAVSGSSHLKITGTGTPGVEYGIKIDGTKSQGLALGGKSTDIEVEHVEVAHAHFAGIMAKTDPTCDLSANRGNFVQRNTVLHHNYIHDTEEGEAFYVGHSFWDGYSNNSGCPGTVLYPHDLVGVKIHDNRVERSASDAIQVGCAVADVEVHDNVILDYGKSPFANNQSSAIQIGGGTTGKWYNNYIRASEDNTTAGLGFSIIGQGHIEIFNNTIVRPRGGFYTNLRLPPGTEADLQNNTVIRPKEYVLRTYDADSAILFRNNLMVLDAGVQGVWLDVQPASYTASNNLTYADVASAGFVNPASHDYHLTAGSPARDAGANASADFAFDMDNQARSDGAFDVGADEYASASSCPTVFTQSFSSSSTFSSYENPSSPSIGQFNDIGAEPNGGTFSITGGRLQLVRAGSTATDNDAGLMRWTDFGCNPSVLHVAFKMSVSAWTASTYQNDAFCLDVGDYAGPIDHGTGGALTDVFNQLCVDGKGPGKFAFGTAGLQSALFNADGTQIAVAYFLNKSGAAKSYRGPDGVVRSLGANNVAVFAGTSLLLDNVPASNGATSALSDFRMRWGTAENATWTLDDLVIKAALPQ